MGDQLGHQLVSVSDVPVPDLARLRFRAGMLFRHALRTSPSNSAVIQ